MKRNNIPLIIVEILVMGGVLFALIFPLFSSEEEESKYLENKIYAQLINLMKNHI